MSSKFDVLAFGAPPEDLEAVMGGTILKLVRKGLCLWTFATAYFCVKIFVFRHFEVR